MKNNLFQKTIIYCMVVGMMIIITACNKDEKDAERLQVLDEQVTSLYNSERTDLADDFNEETIEEIEEQIDKEQKESLDEKNSKHYAAIVADYEQAKELVDFEQEINRFTHQNGEFEEAEFWALKDELVAFESFELFQERHAKNLKNIEKAYKVAKHNKKTEKALARLFTKDNEVIDDITQEAYNKVEKLVSKVKNKDTKKRFETLLKKVHDKLMEILLAEEAERLAEEARQAELEEEERLAAEKAEEALAEEEMQERQTEIDQGSTPNRTPSNDWRPAAPSTPSYTAPTRPSSPSKPSGRSGGSQHSKPSQDNSGSSSTNSGNASNSDAPSSNNNSDSDSTEDKDNNSSSNNNEADQNNASEDNSQ